MMASRKNLEVTTEDAHTPLLKTRRGDLTTTPSTKSKFHLRLSPVSQSVMLSKAQLNIDHTSTEPPNSYRMISPRLPPIKSLPAMNKKKDLGMQKYNTHAGVVKTEEETDEEDRKEYMERMMRTTAKEEILAIDEKPKDTVGQKAVNEYYNHFKKLDKVRDQNVFREVRDSMYTSFLTKSNDLHMFPSKIGFIKEKGSSTTLEIK